jgi:hypothetical protein
VVASVNDSRKLPWLSGLAAAIAVALTLIGAAVEGTLQMLNNFATTQAVDDTTYQP